MDTVNPRMTKATISARLDIPEAKRSTSRLYGARMSPTMIPANSTARKPDPPSTPARPYTAPAAAIARTGYSAGLGSVVRNSRINNHPPATPTMPPMAICRTNSRTPSHTAVPPDPVAESRATITAIPTGSFAPDSPSRMVPDRPWISRFPSTENTTAGSVGAKAVPMSRAVCQATPNSTCAASATPSAVRAVPTRPSQAMEPAEARNRRHPMCIPPSNRMKINATVTSRSSVSTGTVESCGQMSAATAAATRKMAGAGTLMIAVIRLDPTAASSASAVSPITMAKLATSFMAAMQPGGQRKRNVL